jgi:hypothetical protein
VPLLNLLRDHRSEIIVLQMGLKLVELMHCHAERSEASIMRHTCLLTDPSFLRMTNRFEGMTN